MLHHRSVPIYDRLGWIYSVRVAIWAHGQPQIKIEIAQNCWYFLLLYKPSHMDCKCQPIPNIY